MEEADKIKIRKIIQDTINELVYEEVGKMPEKIAQKRTITFKVSKRRKSS